MGRYPVQVFWDLCSFFKYVNDLPNCLDTSCAKMFADDTNITVPGCTFAELEQATNSLQLAKSKKA